MRLIILGFCLFFLSACSVKQYKPEDILLNSTMQERTRLQFRYAQLADELWQRSDQLVNETSDLPMKSNDITTLNHINQNLKFKINQLETRLSVLNHKVSQVKAKKVKGAILQIQVENVYWQPKNASLTQEEMQGIQGKDHLFTIVAGERSSWQLDSTSDAIPKIEVTLSEHGLLYIEGKKVATISLKASQSTTLTSVPLFVGQPFSVGHISMLLRSKVER